MCFKNVWNRGRGCCVEPWRQLGDPKHETVGIDLAASPEECSLVDALTEFGIDF